MLVIRRESRSREAKGLRGEEEIFQNINSSATLLYSNNKEYQQQSEFELWS